MTKIIRLHDAAGEPSTPLASIRPDYRCNANGIIALIKVRRSGDCERWPVSDVRPIYRKPGARRK